MEQIEQIEQTEMNEENDRALMLRRERVFRDRTNPFDYYDDVDFWKRYRFSKQSVMAIVNMVLPRIEHLCATVDCTANFNDSDGVASYWAMQVIRYCHG